VGCILALSAALAADIAAIIAVVAVFHGVGRMDLQLMHKSCLQLPY
jgi:hypothetical protein